MSSSEESLSGPAPESKEGQRRRRTKYDKNQYKILFEAFKSDAYPDINARMALAEQIKVPEPRIQVWFQNRRARDPRKNTKKEKARPLVPEPIHGRVGAPVPRPSQGGLCAPNCPCQQCLLAAQRNASLFSSKPGNASDQAGFGFNPEDLTASQQSSPHLEAGCAETYVGAPEQLLAQGDEAPQGYEQRPPSGEQQPWWSSQPSPEMKPEMEFEQPPSQSLETAVPPWSCWSLPQPPLPQELCSHPASSEPCPKKAPANIRSLFHPYL
ncbi:hypothetical protein CapIbe_007952 [Capra ibex]